MQKFPIGTKYKVRFGKGKNDYRVCTVVDFYTTCNLQNEIVRQRYVSAHDMLGQYVFNYDVCETTIARNVIK